MYYYKILFILRLFHKNPGIKILQNIMSLIPFLRNILKFLKNFIKINIKIILI